MDKVKVKRFIADNSQEAMLKVKMELGKDAVILHSRKIQRPGIFGFLKKPLVEMFVAVDEPDEKDKHSVVNPVQNNPDVRLFDNNKIDELQAKIGNIENMLNHFIAKAVEDPADLSFQKPPELFEKYYNLLLENDVDEKLTQKMMNIVQRQFSFSLENEKAIQNAIKVLIKEYLGTASTLEENMKKQSKIIFVGPTGVGKTTTLAKLAAKASVGMGKSVGLITADTYRIAAVEQLKTYSEILNIPIKVIYEPKEVVEAIEIYKDKDIILIDTAGRNHKVEEQLQEVKELIGYVEEPDVFLVVSALTAYKDIVSITRSYQFLDRYKLLFTKLDEATTLGNILNMRTLTGKPLSYFTTGQSVPDDIEIADAEKIANIIVGE